MGTGGRPLVADHPALYHGAVMRQASALFQSILATQNEFYQADLYTFTLPDGRVFRWTSAIQDVEIDGITWHAPEDQDTAIPLVYRGSGMRYGTGLEVQTLEIVLKCGESVMVEVA